MSEVELRPSRRNWFEATRVPFAARPELDYVAEADVCVIGGGLAGLHVALEVARKGWSVVLLEAQTIAHGASGGNAGIVCEGYAQPSSAIEAAVGLSRARALWKLSRDGVEAVRGLVEAARLPGVALEPGVIHVTRRIDTVAFRAEAERMMAEYGAPGLYWSADRLRADVRSDTFTAGLYDSSGFHIHPLNYCLGVAAEAQRAGARLYEHTPAQSIDLQSIRRTVSTAKGKVRCDHVVIAGSALLAPLFPRVSRGVMPVTSFCAVTERLGERAASALVTMAAVTEHRRASTRFRLVDGDRLLFSAQAVAGRKPEADPEPPLRAALAEVFPALADVRFDHLWAGVNGVTAQGMPQIGEIAPAVWVTTAYGAHGINSAAVAGIAVGRAIVDRNETVRLFEPFLRVGSQGLLALLRKQFELWRSARLDRIDETAVT